MAVSFSRLLRLVLFALVTLIAPLRIQAQDAADEVIGSVGEVEVRVSDVRKQMATLQESEREALRRDPVSFSRYVRALLVQQLVLREALAAKWDKSAEVAERMSLLRDGVVANTYLESKGAVPADYPSPAEVEAAYNANREAFLVPKSWHLAQIFIAAPRPAEGAPEPAEPVARIEAIAKDLASAPANFAVVAARESEEPVSAAQGGEIGWLPESRIHPAIREVLPGMKLGDLSRPVRMDDGWHLIKVLDIREARIPTLEQVREPLTEQLRAERAQAGTQSWLGELIDKNPIAINEMALSKLLPPEGS